MVSYIDKLIPMETLSSNKLRFDEGVIRLWAFSRVGSDLCRSYGIPVSSRNRTSACRFRRVASMLDKVSWR